VVNRLERLHRRRVLLRAAEIEVAVFVGFLVVVRGYLTWKRRVRRAVPRSTWTMARAVCALWGVATALVTVFILLGLVAPTYLERIGL
jgi:hypothetical protein